MPCYHTFNFILILLCSFTYYSNNNIIKCVTTEGFGRMKRKKREIETNQVQLKFMTLEGKNLWLYVSALTADKKLVIFTQLFTFDIISVCSRKKGITLSSYIYFHWQQWQLIMAEKNDKENADKMCEFCMTYSNELNLGEMDYVAEQIWGP